MSNVKTRDDLPLVLTIPQVAKIMNVCEQTCRNEARAGRMPAVHCGRKWLIPRDRFLKWLDGEAIADRA